jgi:myo-inositol-1-phosphate synthase
MANKKVRVAIIGVGNCASSLAQGTQYYKDTADDAHVPGIMHDHIGDIEFTLGIDVNATKVGKNLYAAIFAEPNNTYKFSDVPQLNAPVVRGMTHDGLGSIFRE